MTSPNDRVFAEIISQYDGSCDLTNVQRIGGGCINEAFKITCTYGSFFIKTNSVSELDSFEKEAQGLKKLTETSIIKTPEVYRTGQTQLSSFLLMEWIEGGNKSASFWEKFGRKLARQHQISSNTFGFDYDNYIGRLPQSNSRHPGWSDFFISERIEPQIRLASSKRLLDKKTKRDFEIVLTKLDRLIPPEPPALLHGDLWGGNFLCNENNEPILIDPAIHFGHRETEMAFTTLFSGFDQKFYDAYQNEFPLMPGFDERVELHNLYPLLVHVNLFGPSYLSGIKQTLKKFT